MLLKFVTKKVFTKFDISFVFVYIKYRKVLFKEFTMGETF